MRCTGRSGHKRRTRRRKVCCRSRRCVWVPEQPVSGLFRETIALLASAGVATGVLYLVGHAWISSRHSHFGVPPREITLEPTEYVVRGFNESLPFFFAIALAGLLTAVIFRREAKIALTDEAHQQNILAYCAIAGVMTAAITMIDVNMTPIVLFGVNLRVSLYQIIVVLSTSIFATLVVIAMTGTWGGVLRPILGRTFTGNIVLTLIATIGLVGAASISGGNLASDELWNLADHHEITLTFENGTRSSYFFVAHANGAYYVRDVNDFSATSTPLYVFPEISVVKAEIAFIRGIHSW